MYYNSIFRQLFNFILRYRLEKSLKKCFPIPHGTRRGPPPPSPRIILLPQPQELPLPDIRLLACGVHSNIVYALRTFSQGNRGRSHEGDGHPA